MEENKFHLTSGEMAVFIKCIDQTVELFEKATDIALEKGTFLRRPFLDLPAETDKPGQKAKLEPGECISPGSFHRSKYTCPISRTSTIFSRVPVRQQRFGRRQSYPEIHLPAALLHANIAPALY
ncbi:Uncharacterised protein [Cytobacillus firmus]|nr:Uncharacterised protein [Cytobacillus firmus]